MAWGVALALGVLVDPAVVDQPDRDRVEEVELLPAGPASDDEPGLFQQAQVLHDPEARHVDLGLELGERAAFAFVQEVEQEAAGRVGERLEHPAVVHTRAIYVTKWSPVKLSCYDAHPRPRTGRGPTELVQRVG
jgi:hypothetical protein